MKATLSGSDDRVMMKLLVNPETDRILGCHILGEGAAEMIQLVGIAVKMGATKRDFDQTMALHPSAAEELVTMRTRTARFERTDRGKSHFLSPERAFAVKEPFRPRGRACFKSMVLS